MPQFKEEFGWLGYAEEMVDFEAACAAGVAAEYSDVKSEVDKVIEVRRAKLGDGPRPFTWDLEKELVRVGKLDKAFAVHQQDTGNCVAAGLAKMLEQISVCDVALFKQEEKVRPVDVPWLYATSRNQILGGMRGAGSTGGAGAQAFNKFGVLFEDDEGVPAYGGRSDAWGHMRWARDISKAPYAKYVDVAKDNKGKAIRIYEVDKMIELIDVGVLLTIAGGWSMRERTYEGYEIFNYRQGRGSGHQTHITDVLHEPFLALRRQNQWGENAHGTPSHDERAGGRWQDPEDLDKEMKQAVVYCFIDFEGDPANLDVGIL